MLSIDAACTPADHAADALFTSPVDRLVEAVRDLRAFVSASGAVDPGFGYYEPDPVPAFDASDDLSAYPFDAFQLVELTDC